MPPEEEVLDQELTAEQLAEQSDKGKGKGKGPETETISKAELESLRRDRDEARESERYWAERARGKGEEREDKPRVEPDPEDPDPKNDSLVDDFTSKGLAALTERGIPTTKAVREMIRTEATKIAKEIARETVGAAQQKATTDSTIMSEFADLKDPESELFKQTRVEMQRLVKLDPNAAKSPTALYSAASIAQAKLNAKTPARGRDDDYDDRYDYQGGNEEEDVRRLRADSQGASRGRGAREVLDDEDSIGPQARAVMAGMGISDKEFLAQKRELSGRDGQGRSQRGRR